ncbi:unnamed protein product [Amoebophrya sp. A120]|nr:unnamed protein product [Amoebophrya sp. A120]|eukprot:GSA120T00014352001.1
MDVTFRAILSFPAGTGEAREQLEKVKRLANQRFIAEDDGKMMLSLLESLAFEHNYAGGLFIMGELFRNGDFSPGVEVDVEKAIAYYILTLAHPLIRKVVAEAMLQEIGAFLLQNYKTLQEKYAKEVGVMIERDVLSAEVLRFLQYALEKKEEETVEGRENGLSFHKENDGSPSSLLLLPAEDAANTSAASGKSKKQQDEEARKLEAAKLDKAQGLKEQANDLYRLGIVPGNANGKKQLLEAAKIYEEAFEVVDRADFVYLSNASQAYSKAGEWGKAKEKAELGLELVSKQEMDAIASNKGGMNKSQRLQKFGLPKKKLLSRLGLAQVRLGTHKAAAENLNQALSLSVQLDKLREKSTVTTKSKAVSEHESFCQEVWEICKEIPRGTLPEDHEWAVTTGQLEKIHKPDYSQMEHRICGVWEYGVAKAKPGEPNPAQQKKNQKVEVKKNQFKIEMVPDLLTGKAIKLLYREDEVTVELMQDYLCQWHGDFELIPGMLLKVEFEPSMDQLTVAFVPPPEEEMTDEFREKFGTMGIQKFTATRGKKEDNKDAKKGEEIKAGNTSTSSSEAGSASASSNSATTASSTTSASSQRPGGAGGTGTGTISSGNESAGSCSTTASSSSRAPVAASVPRFCVHTCKAQPSLVGEYEICVAANDSTTDKELQAALRNTGVALCYRKKQLAGQGLDGANLQKPVFAWQRSGQWVFTNKIDKSPFKAPFLLRCANAKGPSPVELKPRPVWFAATKKAGQEEMDKTVEISTNSLMQSCAAEDVGTVNLLRAESEQQRSSEQGDDQLQEQAKSPAGRPLKHQGAADTEGDTKSSREGEMLAGENEAEGHLHAPRGQAAAAATGGRLSAASSTSSSSREAEGRKRENSIFVPHALYIETSGSLSFCSSCNTSSNSGRNDQQSELDASEASRVPVDLLLSNDNDVSGFYALSAASRKKLPNEESYVFYQHTTKPHLRFVIREEVQEDKLREFTIVDHDRGGLVLARWKDFGDTKTRSRGNGTSAAPAVEGQAGGDDAEQDVFDVPLPWITLCTATGAAKNTNTVLGRGSYSASSSSTSSSSSDWAWEREKNPEKHHTKLSYTESRIMERDRKMRVIMCPSFLGGVDGSSPGKLEFKHASDQEDDGSTSTVATAGAPVQAMSTRTSNKLVPVLELWGVPPASAIESADGQPQPLASGKRNQEGKSSDIDGIMEADKKVELEQQNREVVDVETIQPSPPEREVVQLKHCEVDLNEAEITVAYKTEAFRVWDSPQISYIVNNDLPCKIAVRLQHTMKLASMTNSGTEVLKKDRMESRTIRS